MVYNGRRVSTDYAKSRNDLEDHFDQRDFVTAALETYGSAGSRLYVHKLEGLKPNNAIRVYVHVSNAAKLHCDKRNSARDTIVSLDWTDKQNVVGSISARNSVPREINDIVGLRYEIHATLHLEQVTVAKRVKPFDRPKHSKLHGRCKGDEGNVEWKSVPVRASVLNSTAQVKLGPVLPGFGGDVIVVFHFTLLKEH